MTAEKIQYKSFFDNWDNTSSVRSKNGDCSFTESSHNENLFFWSPNFSSIASHPEVNKDLKIRSLFLLHQLYIHLHFTIQLECEVVNKSLCNIFGNKFDFITNEGLIKDAYKIYCDEAYHACMYNDLKAEVEKWTNVVFKYAYKPAFIESINLVKQYYSYDIDPDLIELCFVIVSENLVSSTLRKIPNDSKVFNNVRRSIANHASDEALHRKYFSSLFLMSWERIPKKEKELLSKLFPLFVYVFLKPDIRMYREALAEVGFDHSSADSIIVESYDNQLLLDEIMNSSRHLQRLLERNGVSCSALRSFRHSPFSDVDILSEMVITV